MTDIINHIRTLTHDDLADWVEEKILTRGKSLVNKVRQKTESSLEKLHLVYLTTSYAKYRCQNDLHKMELEQ